MPSLVSKFWLRRTLLHACQLLDTRTVQTLVSEDLPPNNDFQSRRIYEIRRFFHEVLQTSCALRCRTQRDHQIRIAARIYSYKLHLAGSLDDLKEVLETNELRMLTAHETTHAFHGVREGVVVAFVDRVSSVLLSEPRPQEAPRLTRIPLLPLAWARSLTLDNAASVLYSGEAKLLSTVQFADSDPDTRQELRLLQDSKDYPERRSLMAALQASSAIAWISRFAPMIGSIGVVYFLAHVDPIVALLATAPVLDTSNRIHRLMTLERPPVRKCPAFDLSVISETDPFVCLVVPVLLHERLELTELAQRAHRNIALQGAKVRLAILTDFPDSCESSTKRFEQIILDNLIEALELEFRTTKIRWCVLHRDRVYSLEEDRFVGWERKRGKIINFCQLLMGTNAPFSILYGDTDGFSSEYFLMVVDEDTELGYRCIDSLLAAAAFSTGISREQDCHEERPKIFVPQTQSRLNEKGRWRLDTLFGSGGGRSAWFENFGSAPYTGKGLFKASDYHQFAPNSLPVNRILSHDYVEGFALKATYCENATVFESIPNSYFAFCERMHRWARGDFQNLLFANSVTKDVFARIFVFSLVAHRLAQLFYPALLVYCLQKVGRPDQVHVTALLLFLVLGSPLITLFTRLRYNFIPDLIYILSVLRRFGLDCLVAILRCITAAHISCLTAHALLTVGFRALSGRNFLEWRTSSQAEGLRSLISLRTLWVSSGLSLAALGLMLHSGGLNQATGAMLVTWSAFPLLCKLLFARVTAR